MVQVARPVGTLRQGDLGLTGRSLGGRLGAWAFRLAVAHWLRRRGCVGCRRLRRGSRRVTRAVRAFCVTRFF